MNKLARETAELDFHKRSFSVALSFLWERHGSDILWYFACYLEAQSPKVQDRRLHKRCFWRRTLYLWEEVVGGRMMPTHRFVELAQFLSLVSLHLLRNADFD